jgi:hypothetical protein
MDPDNDAVDIHSFMTGKPSKWTRLFEKFININFISYNTDGAYSECEIKKIRQYEAAAKNIVTSINPSSGDSALIEGYAMRAMGNIVDLVVFSTFLRKSLLDAGCDLTVVSPMTLKYEFAKMIFGTDKKGVPRNPAGLAGGKWQKKDMLDGLTLYEGKTDFIDGLISHKEELMSMKNIPSPINDCVDAYALCLLRRNQRI